MYEFKLYEFPETAKCYFKINFFSGKGGRSIAFTRFLKESPSPKKVKNHCAYKNQFFPETSNLFINVMLFYFVGLSELQAHCFLLFCHYN